MYATLTCLILCSFLITYQDLKDRSVLWILFPITGLLLAYMHWHNRGWNQFIDGAIWNLVVVSAIIGILFLYTRFISRKKFLNHSFGLGDLLFFYAFSLGFPTFTFILLFSTSILFTALIFIFYRSQRPLATVPLAGLMSLFLVLTLLLSLFSFTPSLYLI